MRDGNELVGWGMATGVWEALQMPIAVRIVLSANGHAEVSCATSETGTYTIMTQVAADMLGLPLESITIRLGDSTLPQSPLEGGSWIAASVANGIATTAATVREELLRLAKRIPNSPLADAGADEVALAEGSLVSKQDASRAVSIVDIPRSRHDPKILWVDDAEIVGDRITKVRPIPRNLFTQKTERRIGELGASCVALVVSDVSVHEAP